MLWVWVVIWGSLALAAYLWMRIDEAEKAERTDRRHSSQLRKTEPLPAGDRAP